MKQHQFSNLQINKSSNQLTLTVSSDKKKGVVLLAVDSMGCDTLIMRDGTEIKAKVTEVTPTEIKYKYCNNIDGPTYVVNRYLVSYIKYRNGTLDSFVNEHPPIATPTNRNNGNYNQNNRGAFNGNDSHYLVNNYAVNDYVRKKSLATLILGIVSFVFISIGLITSIFAIVYGTKCMRLIKQDPANLWMYRRRTNTGLTFAWIVVALYLLGIIGVIVALVAAGII
ncbi:MAG: hypothetical protein ACYDCN_09585 [Bacteroidia bacterium]